VLLAASSDALTRSVGLFGFPAAGNNEFMIAAAVALILFGVAFLFIVPVVGIPAGIVGVVLVLLWLAGVGRAVTIPGRRSGSPPRI
jgi:hypothetical protein